jgi:outer membrane protein assembly factor BamE (lipoprotein component of BamABCDE complex)
MGNAFAIRLSRNTRRLGLAVALGLGLAACSATYDNHGYVPPATDLAEISVGDTREDVAAQVGRPSAAGVMRDEAWFYTAYRIRNYTYRAPEVIERDIVAISFDSGGRVENVERFGLEDGQVIQLSRRVTETTVQNQGFFQQLLSNFGRIGFAEDL